MSGAQNNCPLHPVRTGMTLARFFDVTPRTLRRWQAAGVDLQSAESVYHHVHGLSRPAPGVEARMCSPTFLADVRSVLEPVETDDDPRECFRRLAGDPDYVPLHDPEDYAKEGTEFQPSAFTKRVLSELKQSLTGLGVLVGLLERDPALLAHYGADKVREAFEAGDDRDLFTLLLVTDNLLSAQVHRLRVCVERFAQLIEH